MIVAIVRNFLLLFVFLLFLFIFIPRKYSIPELKPRTSTQYWNLTTGSRIAYTLIQAKNKRQHYPVIFLQGGPGGPINDWNITTLTPLSEDGYDVYLYDQVGCGFSSRLKNIGDYTAGRHKKDLGEIVKRIRAEKVILIGQSWGAILAALFIADNPGRVDKVIFTGPGPFVPGNYDLENIQPPDSLHLKEPGNKNSRGKLNINFLRTGFIKFTSKRFNWKLASDKEMDNYLNNKTGYYCNIKTVQSFNSVADIRPRLKNCPIPTLIMRGQSDGIKWGYVTEYLNLFPNHKLVIVPNAGHSIAREQPGEYIRAIREFLVASSLR
jgi:proline iminopeptidase